MSKVLQFFREDIDPRFKDVSDRELTNFIKNEYPDFLQDEDFKSWVSDMESAPPPLPDEMEGSEPSFLQNAIDYFKEDMQRPVGMEPPTDPITFNVDSPEPEQELKEPTLLADDIGKPVVLKQDRKDVPLFMRKPGDVTRQSAFEELYGGGKSPQKITESGQTDWSATAESMIETDPTKAIPGGRRISLAETEQAEALRQSNAYKAIERERQKAAAKGESSWSYWLDRMPFMGGMKQAQELALAYDAGDRLQQGRYSGAGQYQQYEDDVKRLGEYLAKIEREDQKGWFQKAGDLLTATPAFGAEIATTFGVFTAGRKVTEKALQKMVSEGLKKKLKGSLTAKAATAGTRSIGLVGGGMTQAFTQPQHIAKNFFETIAAEKIQVGKDDQSRLRVWLNEDDPEFGTAMYEGYVKTAVEMVSEQMGLKAFKALGRGGGEVMKRFTPGLKAAIAKRWFKKNPKKSSSAFFQAARRMGWNGVIGEMMEERYAELGRAALTRDELPEYFSEEFGKQLLMEASVFSIYGKGLRKAGDLYDQASFNEWMENLAEVQATALSLPAERANEMVRNFEEMFIRRNMAPGEVLPDSQNDFIGPKAYRNTPDKGTGAQFSGLRRKVAYLSGKDTPELRERAATDGDVGMMLTPSRFVDIDAGIHYDYVAIDNGAFGAHQKGTEWDSKPFEKMVDAVAENPLYKDKVLFVAVPDVVGDANATLKKFYDWYPRLKDKGLPLAFVAQDGIEDRIDDIPWKNIDVLFVGGTDAWKESDVSEEQKNKLGAMYERAEKEGVPVHVGRVNSARRIGISVGKIGASTVDGTYLLHDNKEKVNIGYLKGWLDDANKGGVVKTSDNALYDERNWGGQESGVAMPDSRSIFYEYIANTDLQFVDQLQDLNNPKAITDAINKERKRLGVPAITERPADEQDVGEPGELPPVEIPIPEGAETDQVEVPEPEVTIEEPVEETVEEPEPLESKFSDLIDDGVEIGLTKEQSREFFKLAVATSKAEKKGEEKTKDPVTGKEFTAYQLMNQLVSEGKPRMGDEFSRRRGYSNEQIEDWNSRLALIEEITSVQGVDMAALQALELEIEKRVLGNKEPIVKPVMPVEAPTEPIMTDVPKFEGNTFEVYQGSGRKDKKSVYSEGAAGPILGEGAYFAQTEKQAKIYGPKVKRVKITLDNPAIINNTEDLMQFAPEGYGEKIPLKPENVNELMQQIRQEMDRQGHDGVIVNVSMYDIDEDGKDVKGIARLFGHSQIVSFEKKQDEVEVDTGEIKENKRIANWRKKMDAAFKEYTDITNATKGPGLTKYTQKKAESARKRYNAAREKLKQAQVDFYKHDILEAAWNTIRAIDVEQDGMEKQGLVMDFRTFAEERGMDRKQSMELLGIVQRQHAEAKEKDAEKEKEKIEQIAAEAEQDAPPPSTKATPAELKKQKAWLVDVVNQAIKNVPDESSLNSHQKKALDAFNEYGAGMKQYDKAVELGLTVTFDVPGDGSFTVLNTKKALSEFKKNINKNGTGYPTSTLKFQSPKLPSTKPRGIPALGRNIDQKKAVKILSPFTLYDNDPDFLTVSTVEDGVMFATDRKVAIIAEIPDAKAGENFEIKSATKFEPVKYGHEKSGNTYSALLQIAQPGQKIAAYDSADLASLMHKALGLKEDASDQVTLSIYSGANGWSVRARNNAGDTFQHGQEGELIVTVDADRFAKVVKAARQLGKEYLSIHIQAARDADQVTDNSPIIIKAPGFTAAIQPLASVDKSSLKRSNTVKDIGDAPLASVEQSTLPRRIEAPHYKTGEMVGLQEIREFISKALDIPIREGVGRRKVWGTFYPFKEVIRMKRINDVPTVMHEVGHYLHYLMFPAADVMNRPSASRFDNAFNNELLPLGARTSTPSYSEFKVLKEGVAEFTRLYVTDRKEAIKKAPKFTVHFEKSLKDFPQIDKILQLATEMVTRYQEQGWFARVGSSMAARGEAMMGKYSPTNWLRNAHDQYINELEPMHRAVKQLEDVGLRVEAEQDAYQLAVNYVGGWRGKVEHSLFHRQIDNDGNDVGESLRDILRGVDDLFEFQVYLVARRAIEKYNQGKQTGVDIPSAKEAVKQLENKYRVATQKLDTFLESELRLLYDAGFLSNQEYNAINNKNIFYVPFHRVASTELTDYDDRKKKGQGGVGLGGEGFVDLSKGGLKGFYGSTLKIRPPLESIIKNMYVTRDLIERNKIANAFVDSAMSVRGGGRILDDVSKKIKPETVTDAEFRNRLIKLGILSDPPFQEGISEVDELLEGKDLSMTIWRATKTSKPRDGIFGVWKNGKQKYYEVDDMDLYRTLQMQDSTSAELLKRAPLMKFLSVPTRMLRAGATLTIEFIARNPFRDQIQAGIYTKFGFIPFFDGFKGLLMAVGKGKIYKKWIKSGGSYAGFVSTDNPDAVYQKLSDIAPRGAWQRIKPWVNPLKALRYLSELTEQATRLSEFEKGLKATGSELVAANASKDVTINFSRHGYKGKALNTISAFYNANVQDWNKFWREHTTRPLQVVPKGMFYITMPSILLWFANKDDEEIQNLPTWRKRGFWNINLRRFAEELGLDNVDWFNNQILSLVPGEDDFILSLPKPFLLGHIYGTSVESALDVWSESDPNGLKKWGKELLGMNPIPFTTMNMTPDSVKPLVEITTNQKFFTGRDLITEKQQKLSNYMQETADTSVISKLAARKLFWASGELVNVSPIHIDHVVKGYFAGIGKYGLDAVDAGLAAFELVDVPAPPAESPLQLVGVKGFFKQPYEQTRNQEDFFSAYTWVEKMLASTTHDAISSDQKYFDKYGGRALYYVRPRVEGGRKVITEIRRIKTAIGDFRQVQQMIATDPNLSPEEKKRQIALNRESIDDLAKTGLELFLLEDLKRTK